MSTKILVLISAVLIIILVGVCIFVPMVWQQPASREYSQFPATEVLLADLQPVGPSSIISINWYTSDKIIIDMAFSTYDGNSHSGGVFDISSGETSPLTIKGRTIDGLRPTISPDGKYLAIDREGGVEIIPVAEATTNEIQLSGYVATSMVWSHDSNYLAFTGGGEIYIYDLRKDQVEMRFDPALPDLKIALCCSLAWSADDQKIAVALTQGKMMLSDIYVLNLKKDQFVQVTNTPDVSEESPVWFPKEDILLFVSTARTGPEGRREEGLVLAREDGRCQMEISKTRGIYSPTWSPDGTKIAFAMLKALYLVDVSALEDQINSFREKCNVTK